MVTFEPDRITAYISPANGRNKFVWQAPRRSFGAHRSVYRSWPPARVTDTARGRLPGHEPQGGRRRGAMRQGPGRPLGERVMNCGLVFARASDRQVNGR